MRISKKTNKAFYLVLAAMILWPAVKSYAACSPGIPCTNYDIKNDPNAGTSPSFNGPKTGTPPPHDTGACDGNFMNQIYAQAYLQGQREVMMAEQLIHKPDSVLEYTCFDQQLSHVANRVGPIFSESKDWDNKEIPLWVSAFDASGGGTQREVRYVTINDDTCGGSCGSSVHNREDYSVFGDERLDRSIEHLIFDTIQGADLVSYISNNFGHTFLGGAITLDNNIHADGLLNASGNPNSLGMNCGHMNTVWNVAHCLDFGEDDRFRNFQFFTGTSATNLSDPFDPATSGDPRTIPAACSPGFEPDDSIIASDTSTKLDNTSPDIVMPSGDQTPPCPVAGSAASGIKTEISNDMIRLANNCDDGSDLNIFASLDIVQTFNKLVKGAGEPYVDGSLDVINCMSEQPRPTGIPVITYEYVSAATPPPDDTVRQVNRTATMHMEHVCLNPGCIYQPAGKVPYTPGTPIPSAATSLAPGFCVPP